MDPNLVKIKDVAVEDMRKGRIGREAGMKQACRHAFDYLCHVLGHENNQVDWEMNTFKDELREGVNGIK